MIAEARPNPRTVSGGMEQLDLNHMLAVLGVVLATVTLPPAAAVPILTLVIGYLSGYYARQRD